MENKAKRGTTVDVEYARSVVQLATPLDRVQRMLALLPQEFVEVAAAQSDDFLYGTATVVQAIHDLIGNDALDDVSQLLENEEDNFTAIRISKAVIGTFGMLEAMSLVACKEIVRRHEQS